MRIIERAIAVTDTVFPPGRLIFRRARNIAQTLHLWSPPLDKIFNGIYRNNSWADPESISGRGSTLAYTVVIRRELPVLLESVEARSLLDAPCGDFNWMRHVALGGVKYIGGDIVPELIARNREQYGDTSRDFLVLDLTKDQLPLVDVILCRDCLIHLSYRHIHAAISNFKKSNARYLLTTTHPTVRENSDIPTGAWRSVNLQLPPFNFPEPIQLITEHAGTGKCLGLWKLETL